MLYIKPGDDLVFSDADQSFKVLGCPNVIVVDPDDPIII
jgi:hypothetical protein